MRFFLGLVLGVILTIGTAYISDAMQPDTGREGAGGSRMVNWTVVNDNLRGVSVDVQEAWARLVSGAKALDRKAETARS